MSNLEGYNVRENSETISNPYDVNKVKKTYLVLGSDIMPYGSVLASFDTFEEAEALADRLNDKAEMKEQGKLTSSVRAG